MKKHSIKFRVTAWYTSLVIIITLLATSVLLIGVESITTFYLDQNMRATAMHIAKECRYRKGKFEFDSDELTEFNADSIIYNGNGELIYGRSPDFEVKFIDGVTQTVTGRDERRWLVYDHQLKHESGAILWIRAYALLDLSYAAIHSTMILALIAFPFFIVLAAIGGYILTKRAFRPFTQIAQTADDIANGDDLKKRIGFIGAKDEIYELAHTFDNMFARLDKAFEMERRFTSDASHELRTPTSVIISQCEYALSKDIDPEERQRSMEIVLKQANAMAALISQLQTLARMDAKRQKLDMETVCLSELTDIVSQEMETHTEEKHITMHTEIAAGIYVFADQTLMTRMIINLISNAINYGRTGGWVNVKLKQCNDTAILSISDNGIGISSEDLPKIWERFFQVDTSRSGVNNSSGLGLSMVQWIVHAHGGSIAIDSQPSVGSTFTVTLPVDNPLHAKPNKE